jgi:phosphatidylserine/phosphatidylglycerophosphate/cardiolipin synthase-like enzyme
MNGTLPRGLSRVPRPLLEQLLTSVEQRRVECPVTVVDLLDAGFGPQASVIAEALAGLDATAVRAVLRLVLAERVHRPPPRLDLVWSGPESRGSVTRDTGLAVQRLFESATRTVLVAGYTFDKPEILAPLHAAMSRGVSTTLFMDIDGHAPSPKLADEYATHSIDRFLHEIWTFGPPHPDIYWDPRTAAPGPPWASLHAKCVVVDEARTLITSANFTDRGQSRNIEVGVLIEDAAFATELSAQWRLLVVAGLVRRYAECAAGSR